MKVMGTYPLAFTPNLSSSIGGKIFTFILAWYISSLIIKFSRRYAWMLFGDLDLLCLQWNLRPEGTKVYAPNMTASKFVITAESIIVYLLRVNLVTKSYLIFFMGGGFWQIHP